MTSLGILACIMRPGGVAACRFYKKRTIELLNTTAKDAQSASYFSYVAAAKKGHTFQKYFYFLEGNESILHKVPLNIKKPRRMTGLATMFAHGSREKYVATVIPTDDKPLPDDDGVLPQ